MGTGVREAGEGKEAAAGVRGGAGSPGLGLSSGMRKERGQSPKVTKRSRCRAWWPG